MRLFYKLNLTVLTLVVVSVAASAQNRFFTDAGENANLQATGQRVFIPEKYRAATFNVNALKNFLWALPANESIASRNGAPVIELPMPDGTAQKFQVWVSSVQEPELEAKFPEIKTFAGRGVDDPSATIRFDYNPYFGFSAQIFSSKGRVLIDPYSRGDINSYMSYFTKDVQKRFAFNCLATDDLFRKGGQTITNVVPVGNCRGTELITYRLVVACTGEYAQAVGGGTAGGTHAAIVTAINRINQVYETELSVHVNLVANNNLVEYLNPATDPYLNDADQDLNRNTPNVNAVIGAANYDYGHIFCTTDGGVAYLRSVCSTTGGTSGVGGKAGGLTGLPNPVGDPFYIDYVAHEMGHQFGGSHTFDATTGSCGGSNRSAATAYEVGSGTTIMAYAGICGATNNIQNNSDPFFHSVSFDQISAHISAGGSCGVITPSGNAIPVITSMQNNGVSIPVNTPFTLTGAATDADGNSLTYDWEEWDQANTGGNWNAGATNTVSPIFKSRIPKASGSRTFPDIAVIVAGYPANPPATMGGLKGETLPQVARALKFRLTVRDGMGGIVTGGSGCGTFSAPFQVNVVNSGTFAVSIPNGGETYNAGTSQTITWNNTGTTAAPFNVSNVRITLSTDGGLTYPHELSASTPNDGSESLTLPIIPATTTARIRIEALGNIFFDISNANFTINAAPSGFSFNSPAAVTSACPAVGPMQATLTATYIGGFDNNIVLTSSVSPTAPAVPVAPVVTFGTNPLTISSTSTTVNITNAAALYAGTYTVTVTGTAGALVQTRDITFTITGGAGPAVTTPPANQTVCVGDNATFTVVAPTATAYQWQVSTAAIPTFTNIGGATTATLNLSGVTIGMNGNQYRCVVSTQCGSTNSAAATLTVNTAPAVTTNPQDITLCANSNHTFTVAATGTGLIYQWQESTNGGGLYTPIVNGGVYSGQGTNSLTLTGITAGMTTYRYRAVITGACPGTATSNGAILTVVTSVAITSQPASTTVCDGATTNFTVAGSGTGIIYQWQVNTGAGFVNVPAGAPYSGAGSATLTITGATPSMSGYQYRAQLSNATCTTPGVSDAATLTVNTLPAVTTNPTSATICVGGNNTFSAAGSGTGFGYQWQVNTGSGFADIPSATASSYAVTSATAAMNGYQYRVIVTGTCPPAATSSAATLTVISPVTIAGAGQPAANTEICSGSNTSLTVTGTSTQPITYQWQVSTAAVPTFTNVANGNGISGANTATITFTNSTVAMSGTYRVQLSNTTCTAPTTSASAVLTVRQLPTVGLTASLTALLPGQTSLLTATPSAQTTGTLTTTWLKNGTAVANVGNTRSVNIENVGTYRVTIQEIFGTGFSCSNQSADVVITATPSNNLFIFPSPNDGNFTVSYYNNGGSSTSRTIIIFDGQGNKVYNKQFPITGLYTLIPVNMTNAARGIYFVAVGDAAGKKLAEGKVHVR